MKNILIKIIGLIFLFSIFVSVELRAEEVKETDVKKVAVNAFSDYSGKTQNELETVQIIPVNRLDTALFYVFNFEKGFIIIAADNISEPVLGYGLTSRIDFDDIPPALQDLLDGYEQEIVHAKKLKHTISQEISNKWNYFLNLSPNRANPYIPSTYLMETTWNQNRGNVNNNITYNYYCPVNAQGQKTVVGCGGVAVAQILNYWTCKVHPQNTVNYTPPGLPSIYINLVNQIYDWDNMAPYQANSDNAKFLYHCAAAIESEFGAGATTSYPYKIPGKLNQNFGFSAAMYYRTSYNDQNWISLLKANIDNRRPVFYTGQKSSGGGHGWVVDGYNSNNYFHCNWGWGGTSDGWFNLSGLTGNVAYNNSQSAVMNIYPTYYNTGTILQNMTIGSNIYTGHTITITNCNIQNNSTVILKADCITEIFGPFEVPLGSTLEVK